MKELSLEELKRLQLDMLLAFDEYCQENKLSYSLGGGTLLGAVRHEGFIPWDDDIDINMPRSDYEKFMHEYIDEKGRYKLASVELGDDKPIALMIQDTNTTLTDLEGKAYIYESVWIDVFPIDELSNNKFIRYLVCFIKELLIYFFDGAILPMEPTKRYKDTNGGIFNWRAKIRTLIKYVFIGALHNTSGCFWGNLANKLARCWEGKKTNYSGCMITGAHHNSGISEMLPKKIFKKYIKMKFEGHEFDVIAGYDEYLTSLYGDYMKMPPKGKQVSHHDFRAYYKESK